MKRFFGFCACFCLLAIIFLTGLGVSGCKAADADTESTEPKTETEMETDAERLEEEKVLSDDTTALEIQPETDRTDLPEEEIFAEENTEKEGTEPTPGAVSAFADSLTEEGHTEDDQQVSETDAAETDPYAVYENTLLIGDSRMEGFRLYSGVKNATFFCAKSLTAKKILDGQTVNVDGQTRTIYETVSMQPFDKVILSLGINDLGGNYIETFTDNYGALIALVKEKQPEAKIFLQAILPVTKEKSDSHAYNNNAQIYWYNLHIIEMAEAWQVGYINPAAAVVDVEGCLISGAASDGIHFNKEYCIRWAEHMAELLQAEEAEEATS